MHSVIHIDAAVRIIQSPSLIVVGVIRTSIIERHIDFTIRERCISELSKVLTADNISQFVTFVVKKQGNGITRAILIELEGLNNSRIFQGILSHGQ